MEKRLLVPIDFSNFNRIVINEAIEQAKLMNAKIYLIHVATLDLGVIVSETGFTYVPELEENILSEEAEQLEILKKEVIEQGIDCEYIIEQGIPADTIVQKGKDLDVSMIVIGSLGHNTLYNVFIGSVASDVIKHATVPLLVIPKEKES
ncbi:MAG: universal stress protein [Moheibacter sp.]